MAIDVEYLSWRRHMAKETIEEVIDRQESKAAEVSKKRDQYEEQEQKFIAYFSSFDEAKVRKLFGNPIFETKIEMIKKLADIKAKSPKKFDYLSKKSDEIIGETSHFDFSSYEKAKVQYLESVFEYFQMIEQDKQNYFPTFYRKILSRLGDDGWFLFFEETPGLQGILTDELENNKVIICNSLSENHYLQLLSFLSNVFKAGEETTNKLQIEKTIDLKAAVYCLMNGFYRACARTMFSLLENEHLNASLLNEGRFYPKPQSGDVRSDAIANQLLDLKSFPAMSEFWNQFNVFYKAINTNQGFKGLSRNKIVHGGYSTDVSASDCLQLILAYLSFKTFSFYLRSFNDAKIMIQESLIFANTAKGSKEESKS
jgi:hypothetical protein